MKLKFSEHKGFKRFKLRPIAVLTYRPEYHLSFIIGTNGCGKSSLLGQWDPEPKSSNDYYPGGHCKQIWEDASGVEYRIESYFDKRGQARHHFIRDGVPLNNGKVGGTAAVQRQLVEEYFNYNKQIHNVLSSRVSFSGMTPNQRQSFITQISNCDLSYAFKVYANAQSALRNSKGTQKDLTRVVAKDKDKLSTFNIDEVNKNRQQLMDKLNALNSQLIQSAKNDIDQDVDKFTDLEAKVIKLLEDAITRTNQQSDLMGVRSKEELQGAIQSAGEQKAKLTAKTEFLGSQYARVEKEIETLQKSLAQSGSSIRAQLDQFKQQRANLPSYDETLVGLDISNITRASNQLNLWLSTHSGLEAFKKTVGEMEKIHQFADNYRANLSVMESEANRLRHWIDHAKTHDKVNCPKCQYSFTPGIDLNDLPSVEANLKAITERIEQYTKKYHEAEQYIEHYDLEVSKRQQLKTILADLNDTEAVFALDQSVNQYYHQLSQYLQRVTTAQTTHRQRESLDKDIALLEQRINSNDESRTEQRLLEAEQQKTILDKQMHETMDALLVAESKLKAYNEIQQQYDYQTKLLERASIAIEQLTTLSDDIIKFECNRFIKQQMEELHKELGKTQQVVADYRTLEESVKRLEEIKHQATERQKHLEIIVKALSPNEGLLADQLSTHINLLLRQVNSVIASIWGHDLVLLPCEVEETGLTYRFPFYVGGDDEPTADISMASRGQREIIDFAFVIVSIMQRETCYPLYLDEIGSSFDNTHRNRFMVFLKELITNKKVSQVFMVDHFATMFNTDDDYDAIVLDKTNVIVPTNSNRNVSIK